MTSQVHASEEDINDEEDCLKNPPKNPTDPNLLAKDVMEAFLGEPIIVHHKKIILNRSSSSSSSSCHCS
jgi:hypothetical protein